MICVYHILYQCLHSVVLIKNSDSAECNWQILTHTHRHTWRLEQNLPPCIQMLNHNLWNSTLALTFCSFPATASPALCARLSLTPPPAPFFSPFKHTQTYTHTHTPDSPPHYSFIFPLHPPLTWLGSPHTSSPRLHARRAGSLSVFIPLLEDK